MAPSLPRTVGRMAWSNGKYFEGWSSMLRWDMECVMICIKNVFGWRELRTRLTWASTHKDISCPLTWMCKVPGLVQWLHDAVRDLTFARYTLLKSTCWWYLLSQCQVDIITSCSHMTVSPARRKKGMERKGCSSSPLFFVFPSTPPQPSLHISLIGTGSPAQPSRWPKGRGSMCLDYRQARISFWDWEQCCLESQGSPSH